MEQVRFKIKKLLALANSNNENEAKTALLKAQELMVKYNIEEDMQGEYDENNPIIEYKTKHSFRKYSWKNFLSTVIADNFKCYTYYKTQQRTNTIYFYGRKNDIDITVIIYDYAINFIMNTVNKIRREYYKKNKLTKGIENEYAIGFLDGLKQGYEEQINKHEEWGLILVKDSELTKNYEKINIKEENIDYIKKDREIYNRGFIDGTDFSKTDKVNIAAT